MIPTYVCVYRGVENCPGSIRACSPWYKQGDEKSLRSMHFTPKLGVILTYNYIGLPLKIQTVFIPKHLTKTPLHLPLKIYSLIFLHFLTLYSRQNMT